MAFSRSRQFGCLFLGLAAAVGSTLGGCGEALDDPPASVGKPCVPEDESFATFSGFSLGEVNIGGAAACGSGSVCLVHQFQGRVSCSAGQSAGGQGCLTPEGEAVSVPVMPQLAERPAAQSVFCSCRCDAPFDADYCACPSGMRCEEVIADQGEALRDVAGSYCVY